jgi:SAM-dependent methyltransferase
MSDEQQQAPFWESPDVVQRFAERDPDHRLSALAPTLDPANDRVLDVGCAGGRNTVFLAQRGVHVEALDSSAAMVEETRRRLAPILGEEEARRRVRHGRMDDLSTWGSGVFDLVVALGIHQNAESLDEWDRAIAEAARVLRPGGRMLVAHFTPDLDLTGDGVEPVDGEPHVYAGLRVGVRAVLLYADELEAAMARHGFAPQVPSETVVVELERGRRATVNALFERVGRDGE